MEWQTIPNLPSVKNIAPIKKTGILTIRIFFSGVMKVSDIMSGYQNPDYILAKRSPLGKIILK